MDLISRSRSHLPRSSLGESREISTITTHYQYDTNTTYQDRIESTQWKILKIHCGNMTPVGLQESVLVRDGMRGTRAKLAAPASNFIVGASL